MRRWVGVFLAAGVTACALAIPSEAIHVRTLTVVGSARLELPSKEATENDAVHFAWDPPAADIVDGDSLLVCWNGRFDRSQLVSDRAPKEICSSGQAGGQMGTVEGNSSGRYNPLAAGHYEAFVRRFTACVNDCYPPPPPDWSASNVVSFDVVDPCRLRLEGFRGKAPSYLPMVVGQPVPCSVGVSGDLRVSGEDGSVISLASSRLSSIEHNEYELPWIPILQIGARGANSDVSFSLKKRLSQFTIAHTGSAMLIAVSPVTAKIVHRKNVSRIHVLSGRVVALGIGSDYIQRGDLVPYCGRKAPTIACLSRIRYRYFTMKRGTSLRAKVLRAGQKATFRKAKSLASIVH
jgi:hypothetical protein